ncbi:MAG: MSCRAMM family protein [Candidatus Aminicenantales bacterium]
MTIRSFGRSKGLVYALLAAFAVFMMPMGLAAKEPNSGALSGFVYAKDVKTPVAGAVVKIRNLADMKEIASTPTDANGMYTISGIPEGRYMLGVTSVKDDFNLDYALYVKAGELGKLSISLAPGAGGGGSQESGETAAKKKGFFSSVAGRVLIVAAVGVGLYFLIIPNNEASPIR